MIGWAQIVGSLSVTFNSVPWPQIFVDYTMNFGAIFNLNIGRVLAITNCHMNLPFLDGYIVHLLFLVYLCMAVVIVYVLALCCWGKSDM